MLRSRQPRVSRRFPSIFGIIIHIYISTSACCQSFLALCFRFNGLTGHTMSPDHIDEAILVCCKPRLQKVARIMGDVTTALNARVDAPFYAPEGSPRGINPELDL